MPRPKYESTRRATYQDVLDAPAHRVAEIIDGTLYTHLRPAAPHARASSSLGVKIGGPFDYDAGGPGGWWIIDEPELHPGEEVLVPDLAGWRRERMPDYPDTAYFTSVPDWVREPRPRRMAEQVVSLLESATEGGESGFPVRAGIQAS